MKIHVNDRIQLSEIHPDDKPAITEHLQAKEIYDCTLRIPYPYTEADAETWLEIVAKSTAQHGRPVHWAIRDRNEQLIGCCGLDGVELGKSHRAEIGYWLGKSYWGQGIATAAVGALSRWPSRSWGSSN